MIATGHDGSVMAMSTTAPSRPLGRLLTAMVTPFDVAGDLDLAAAVALATHLVDEQGNDGLVLNGTTGEAPTTSDVEKAELVAAVADAVGDRAVIVAGVGTFDTVHSMHLADQAAKAGAQALLVVAPYYSRPPQDGLLRHFRAVADATDLPVAIYDIPKRSGVAVETETMMALAQHERIVAVKDAKGDIAAAARVLAETGLAYYAGDDAMVLPMLSIGGAGVIGTSTHFSGAGTKALIEAYDRGDAAEALRLYRELLPIYTGIFRTQGVILVKAGLTLRGRSAGPVRLPMVEATEHELSHLRQDLADAGLG